MTPTVSCARLYRTHNETKPCPMSLMDGLFAEFAAANIVINDEEMIIRLIFIQSNDLTVFAVTTEPQGDLTAALLFPLK